MAEREQTEVEVWPVTGESRQDFLDRCIVDLTPCIGDRAEEVCEDKWEASKELGKKALGKQMFSLRTSTDSNLAIEPCGKTCRACDGADAPFLTDEQRRAVRDEWAATLERVREIKPRPRPLDIPTPHERWKAEAREQERRQRQKEVEMTEANNAAYWAAIDAQIEQTNTAEREFNRAVLAEIIAELEHIFETRLRAIEARLQAFETANGELVSRVTALSNGGPNSSGVIRKQVITPH